MENKILAVFIILVGLTISNSAMAQRINYEKDFLVGKITLKFVDGAAIDLSLNGNNNSNTATTTPMVLNSKAQFFSNLAESPRVFPLPLDAPFTLGELRAELNSLNSSISKLGIAPRNTFLGHTTAELNRLRKNAETTLKQSISDLTQFYDINFKEKTVFSDVEQFIRSVEKLKMIESIQPISPPVEPPSPNFQSQQTYLPRAVSSTDHADGVGALTAWSISGGSGSNIKIMDIEYDWNIQHEDFPDTFFVSGGFFSGYGDGHGTAVAGILSAKNNNIGVTGIAYGAELGLMSSFATGPFNLPHAILSSISHLDAGDIILIEQQTPLPISAQNDTCSFAIAPYGPTEWENAVFSAIQTATGNGIVVVEAGGNGGINLDHASLLNRFNRATRDSGAIIVAAGRKPPSDHRPTCYSPHGDRIDSHARGIGVATLGHNANLYNGGPNATYTNSFDGTSSASPIVAASVAAIQGMLKAQGLPVLSPLVMRQLLTTTGSPQTSDLTRTISTVPDIIKAAKSLGLYTPTNLAPIYYLLD